MTSNATFKHLNANGATTIGAVSSHTTLLGITINTKGATANTCTVLDVATNTTIAVIDTTGAVGFIDFFGLRCKDGVTITLATGTAADITVLTA